MVGVYIGQGIDFNPRTPYGMRPNKFGTNIQDIQFQSTHPLRDATKKCSVFLVLNLNFNPRTPYGMRRLSNYTHPSYTPNFNPRTPYGMRLSLF